MHHVTVRPLESYEDESAIRDFVRDAVGLDESLRDHLRSGPERRLVVVKPNWVQQAHEHRPDVWVPLITHPAVVLATLEGVAEASEGRVTIALCDGPHTYADFEAILSRGEVRERLSDFCRRWPDVSLEAIDLRREVWITREGVIVERRPNPPDPRGYVRLDLGCESLFFGHRGEGRYYGADYDEGVVNSHHRGELHEYLLAGTPMACDLFINLPKLKTHKKTGMTCCLKNLVGINGDRNWLPHYVEASPRSGGDEYPRHALVHELERSARRIGRKTALALPVMGPWMFRKARKVGMRVLGDSETTIRNGNWLGNDTCWRMALDLNRALLFGDPDGGWREAATPKRYLAIVDGIVGGQGNGPLCPEPVESRVLAAGTNPASVDAVACRLMGFEPDRLRIVRHAFDDHRWPIHECAMAEVRVRDDRSGGEVGLEGVAPALPGGFEPHFGWADLKSPSTA